MVDRRSIGISIDCDRDPVCDPTWPTKHHQAYPKLASLRALQMATEASTFNVPAVIFFCAGYANRLLC